MTELDAILSDLERAVHGVPRRRPRRRLALAAPLAVAVAIAVAFAFGVGNEQPAAAAQQLEHAARLVAGDPAPVIGPGQYWYVKGTGAFANGADTFVALQTSSHEIWIASDRSGRIVRKDGPPHFFSAAERARWEAAGKPGFGPESGIDSTEQDLSFGWDTLGVHAADQVPTDPAALAALVERAAQGTKNPLPWEEFSVISDVLRLDRKSVV